jgi:hypothetical protein
MPFGQFQFAELFEKLGIIAALAHGGARMSEKKYAHIPNCCH